MERIHTQTQQTKEKNEEERIQKRQTSFFADKKKNNHRTLYKKNVLFNLEENPA
jgi:hypothetical protein